MPTNILGKTTKTDLQKCQLEVQAANERLEACRAELEACQTELQSVTASKKELDVKIARLVTDMGDLINKNLELTGALDEAIKRRPSLSVDELVGQLRASVQALNAEAGQTTQDGKPRILVDQFEVEIKGGVDLKEGFRLTQPQGQEISPQSVSTIRFALKPVPIIVIDDSSTDK